VASLWLAARFTLVAGMLVLPCDASTSTCRRGYHHLAAGNNEGAARDLHAPTRAGRCGERQDAASVARWAALAWYSKLAAKERASRPLGVTCMVLTVSGVPVSCIYRDVLLMARPSKSDRIFACTLCQATSTVGMIRDINLPRSSGRAISARASEYPKVRQRTFLRALKRYLLLRVIGTDAR
jgi:hypothetical protein